MTNKIPNQNSIEIDGKKIGNDCPTYFVADIAANHDGDLERAKDLIHSAAFAGADAAKFQHFKAETIVSDIGFKSLDIDLSHQEAWNKSAFQVYKEASVSTRWTAALKSECDKAGITFMTTPYSFELTDHIDPYVPAYKIGSGDITWLEFLSFIAKKHKPVLLASGASDFLEVKDAVKVIREFNHRIVLMQCNTNYTGNVDNFNFINLNVLNMYQRVFPDVLLGLSDHTPGCATVLGAVTLGARVIEKHFTDDTSRVGPDHKFSLDEKSWREMVDRTRELEAALGTDVKKVENNEIETVVLQRRAIRVKTDLPVGHKLERHDLEVLRPCPKGALPANKINFCIGKNLIAAKLSGEHLALSDIH